MARTLTMTVLGRVGKDPETRTLQNGSKVTKFNVAVSEKYKNKAGDWVENTTWVKAEAWDKLGDIFAEHTKKGDEIFLIGTPKSEAYIDKEGNAKSDLVLKVRDFDFIGGKSNNSAPSEPATAQPAEPAPKATTTIAEDLGQNEDDLPF